MRLKTMLCAVIIIVSPYKLLASTLIEDLSENIWELGLVVDQWVYKEPNVMKDSGLLKGAMAKARYLGASNRIVIEGEIELIGGDTTYDGQYQNGTPLTKDSLNYITETSVMFGYAFGEETHVLIPKLGLYYRQLQNHEDPNFAGDYRRDQTYRTYPLELEYYYKLQEGHIIGAAYTYHFAFQGKNKSYLSDYSSEASDLEFTQNSGSGYKFEVFYIYDNYFKFNLFYRHWSVADSDYQYSYEGSTLYQYHEPKNSTESIGLVVSVLL